MGMLVLSRRVNEDIIIGDPTDPTIEPIMIRVAEIRGDKVRIGIVASESMPVHRREVARHVYGEFTIQGLPETKSDNGGA